jgi:Double-GTPase 2
VSSETPIVCDHDGCEAAGGGACALGHPSPSDCPDAVASAARRAAVEDGPSEESTVADTEEAQAPPPPPGVELGGAIALTVEEGNALAARHGARLVLPAGPSDAGKTSFIVELYARFLAGKQEGASFYESQTLLEFELLSFPARLQSEEELPKSWRTRMEDAVRPLLHLGIKPPEAGPMYLLFGNYSGEFYERISDHGEALREVPLLSQCDRLLIFVDGKLLSSGGTRTEAIARTRQLIRVLGEERVLGPSTQVALVVAKLDCLEAEGEGVLAKWAEHEERLRAEIEGLEFPSRVFRIAMRPRGGYGAGEESTELFRWLLEPDQLTKPPPQSVPASERAFERYGDADE